MSTSDLASTTRARPVAKFTSARSTPGCLPSTRSTRVAHEPQVIPPTVKSTLGCAKERGDTGSSLPGGVGHRRWPEDVAIELQRAHQLIDDLRGAAFLHRFGHARLQVPTQHD